MSLVPKADDPYDRTNWSEGPWDGEPDREYWRDEETGLPCLAIRNRHGAWCGYAAVSEGHPWYGVHYGDCPKGEVKREGKVGTISYTIIQCDAENAWCDHRPEHIIDVHGGLTYSDFCTEDDKEHGICHIPEAGEPDKVWWFGFDCAHFDDCMPAFEARMRELEKERPALISPRLGKTMGEHTTYKSLAYVKEEVKRLATQLKAIQVEPSV